MIEPEPYSIDIDAKLIVGGGCEAHFMISAPDGEVVVRRRLNRRFDTYSAALMAAYEGGRFAIESLMIESPSLPVAVPAASSTTPSLGLA